MARSIKLKLRKAKLTLNQTLQKILDINRLRKQLPNFDNAKQLQKQLKEELRILNKIVEHQAKLIKYYERTLATG